MTRSESISFADSRGGNHRQTPASEPWSPAIQCNGQRQLSSYASPCQRDLPPLRLLLVWSNLTGHKTSELWLCAHGIMP